MLLKPKLSRVKDYLLADGFNFPLAAGAVNGTRATPPDGCVVIGPTPNTRTVTDAESKFSIAGGVLSFVGGKASPENGDPGLWYQAVTRVAGQMLLGRLILTQSNTWKYFGFSSAQSSAAGVAAFCFNDSGRIIVRANALQGPIIQSYTATTYNVAIVLRTTGAFLFIRGGTFSAWTLLWVGILDNTATIYGGVQNYDAIFTADNVLIPAQLWLPPPSLSDSFARSNGVLGVSDGLYFAEQNGGGNLTWNFDAGVATIATNKAVISPTLGAEQATGNLVVGTWYSITATQADYFYVGSAIGDTFRAAATTALDANNKVKAITLSSMFATVAVGTTNVKVRGTVAALTSKTTAGVAIINSAAAPTQGIIFCFDGSGNCKIDEFTTATTWNALATAVKAFTAADVLELDVSSTAYRAYHVTAAGTATLIASGTLTAALAANVGIFSAAATNTFGGAGTFAKGNEGQYAVLDQLGA